MTTLVANTFNWVGLESIANWFKKLDAALTHRRNVNRTIKELSKLSDRELNDIGLARGDIWWVANEAYFDNRAEENSNLKGWV